MVIGNQSSTGAPAGQWPFSTPLPSPGHSSAATDYSDYRYDCVPLPPAGQSSKQRQDLADQARGVSTKRATLQAHDQCLSARSIRRDAPTILGAETGRQGGADFVASSKARLNPGRYQDAAGQTSARAVTAIHQNLYDVEANIDRQACPRQAVIDRAAQRNAEPECRMQESKLGAGEHEHCGKAVGECGIRMKQRTDPITHFAHENRNFDPFGWWRPAQKPTQCGGSQRQTFTWQVHSGPSNDEKAAKMSDPEFVRAARGDLVNTRGERMYNMFGAEDMLPSGIFAHIKCDVPPSKAHVHSNDRKYLPVCARPDAPQPQPMDDKACSKKVWGIFRDGAHCREADAKAAQETSRQLRRTQSARPVMQTLEARELPEDELPMWVRCRRPLGYGDRYYKAANPITGSEAEERPLASQSQADWSQASQSQAEQPQERPQVPPEPQRPSSAGSSASAMGRRANSTGAIRRGVVAASPSQTGSVGGSRSRGYGNLEASPSQTSSVGGSRSRGYGNPQENVRRSSNASLADSRRSIASSVASQSNAPVLRRSPSSVASESNVPGKSLRRCASDTSLRSSTTSRPYSTSKASFAELTKSRWN